MLVLCSFLGPFGVRRFFVGKIGTGVLTLVTLGCFGIWTLVGLILFITGKFTDSEGRAVKAQN